MKTKYLALVLIGISITTVAHATETHDWYVSGAVGMTMTQDSDFSDPGETGKFSIGNTANFSVAAGRKINDRLRGEVEISHRNADIESVTVNGVGSASASGSLKTTAVMLNGYYNLFSNQTVNPYLTAGIGDAHHAGEITSIGGVGLTGFSAADNVFAYKIGAGTDITINDRVTAFADYRYFGTSDANFDGMKVGYGAHEVRAGLRYGF